MRIVIEIDEYTYREVQKFIAEGIFDYNGINAYSFNSIANGTPLPKCHGRLGDLDALEEYFRNVRARLNKDDYNTAIEYLMRYNLLLNVEQFIHLEPTIIGADSEVEE